MTHLEGRLSILAALEARQRSFQVILIRHDMHDEKCRETLAAAEARGVPVRMVDRGELDALAHGATHGGFIAICSPKPRATPAQILDLTVRKRTPPLLLLLEGVDDARNLGFTLRTADALGVDAVLIKKHLWDFDEVEVARPASGAYERMPIAQIESLDLLHELRKRGLTLYGCIAGAKRTMFERDLARPAILAIGGEKRGLSGAVRAICDAFLSIPTVRPSSSLSLSLSHAGAIVLAEAMRQRSRTAPAVTDSPAAEPAPPPPQ